MLISVVIPVLNEQDNIVAVERAVREALQARGAEFEIIFVNDGSTDRSLEIVRELHARDPRVKALSFSRNFGHQFAITAGMDHAKGDAILTMDADLQHPPELIGRMLELRQAGYQIVYTVRDSTAGASWFKRTSASAFYRVFHAMTGISIAANGSDFRLIDRTVADTFRNIRERTRFIRGLTSWVGFRSIGLNFSAGARRSGASKFSLRKMLLLATDGILAFSTFPLQLAIYLGFALAVLGALYFAFALYARFVTGQVIEGWTSVILLVTTLGGIQLVVLGVIGLYLGKVFEEVKQRPLYVLSEVIGLESLKGSEPR